MAIDEFQYATGFDNEAGFTNVETTVPTIRGRIRAFPVTLGSVELITADGTSRLRGTQTFTWTVSILYISELYTLITDMFGDFSTRNADLTVRTLVRTYSGGAWQYGNFNVKAAAPQLDLGDYQQAYSEREVRDIVFPFLIVSTT